MTTKIELLTLKQVSMKSSQHKYCSLRTIPGRKQKKLDKRKSNSADNGKDVSWDVRRPQANLAASFVKRDVTETKLTLQNILNLSCLPVNNSQVKIQRASRADSAENEATRHYVAEWITWERFASSDFTVAWNKENYRSDFSELKMAVERERKSNDYLRFTTKLREKVVPDWQKIARGCADRHHSSFTSLLTGNSIQVNFVKNLRSEHTNAWHCG